MQPEIEPGIQPRQQPVNQPQDSRIPADARYNIRRYELSDEFLASVMTLESRKTYWAIARTWVQIILLVTAARFVVALPYGWLTYLPAIFFIAGRQGAFLQLVHEATHGLISESKVINYRVGQWLCALPIGITVDGYGSGHIQHHGYTGTSEDPPSDTEKYRITDVREPKLYALFLKDILGITALMTFFAYGNNEGEVAKKKTGEEKASRLISLFHLCLVQTVVLGAIFQFDVVHYILLWIFPAMGPHMFLMRVRGMGEHGLPRQLGVHVENQGVGTFYTRSFLTPVRSYKFVPFQWIEKALIGSIAVHYHHEHHLMPKVPFYNLKRVHEAIRHRVSESNPEIYVRGYFSAAFRSVLEKA